MSGARIRTDEDEAWEAIEAKQYRAAIDATTRQQLATDALQRAAYAAMAFVEDSEARDLAIMTLRKAFELGYRQGWDDKK
jgi:hypothetical protein